MLRRFVLLLAFVLGTLPAGCYAHSAEDADSSDSAIGFVEWEKFPAREVITESMDFYVRDAAGARARQPMAVPAH